MSSSPIEYICPKTGKTKEKAFSDGVTFLKKKHFKELIQLREDQAEIKCQKEDILKKVDQVNFLSAERESALVTLKKEKASYEWIQDGYTELLEISKQRKKSLESSEIALSADRKNTKELEQVNAHLIRHYNDIKASFEEQKRKNLESEKQSEKERIKQKYAKAFLDGNDQILEIQRQLLDLKQQSIKQGYLDLLYRCDHVSGLLHDPLKINRKIVKGIIENKDLAELENHEKCLYRLRQFIKGASWDVSGIRDKANSYKKAELQKMTSRLTYPLPYSLSSYSHQNETPSPVGYSLREEKSKPHY